MLLEIIGIDIIGQQQQSLVIPGACKTRPGGDTADTKHSLLYPAGQSQAGPCTILLLGGRQW